MPSLELIKTWAVEEVEPELRDALALVDRLDPPVDLRADTFRFAVQLLTQRVADQQGSPIATPGRFPLQ